MDTIASQITSLTIVYSTVYSDADQRKHQSSASLAFVRGILRGSVNSPHKWPVTRNMFPFDDFIMRNHLSDTSASGPKVFAISVATSVVQGWIMFTVWVVWLCSVIRQPSILPLNVRVMLLFQVEEKHLWIIWINEYNKLCNWTVCRLYGSFVVMLWLRG